MASTAVRCAIFGFILWALHVSGGHAATGDSWREVFPRRTDGGFSSVVWTGSGLVAVGGMGMVATSYDGRSWVMRPVPSGGSYLYDVCADNGHVFACGGAGLVLKSLDGGITWTSRPTGSKGELVVVAAAGANVVTAPSDGNVYVSHNEGASWTKKTPGGGNIACGLWTGNSFLLASSSAFLRSTDSGESWVPATGATSSGAFAMSMAGDGSILACATNKLLRSTDDGITWQQINSCPGTFAVTSNGLVAFSSVGLIYQAASPTSAWVQTSIGSSNKNIASAIGFGSSAIAVGSSNGLFEYNTISRRITDRSPWTTDTLVDAVHVRGKTWAVGIGGAIMMSRDGDRRWEHRDIVPGDTIRSIKATDNGLILAGGLGVTVSEDDGESWSSYPVPSSNGAILSATTIGNTWFASSQFGRVYRSADHGHNWTMYQHPSPTAQFQDMASQGTRVIAVGGGGEIFQSQDSGLTWSPRSSGVTSALGCVFVTSSGTWLAGGVNSVILKSDTGGLSWTQTDVPVSGTVTGFCQTPAGIIAAVRTTDLSSNPEAKVVFSPDSGATWTACPTGSKCLPACVVWNGQKALVMGDGGALLEGAADGSSWTSLEKTGDITLNDLVWTGSSLFAVGNGGLMIRSDDHGLTWSNVRSGTTENLMSIAWTGQSLIAVTRANPASTVRRSSDGGLTWQTAFGNFPTYFDEVVSGGGQTIVVSASGYRVSSDDGVTWKTPTTIPSGIYHMDWANGYFYGGYGFAPDRLYRSSNGVSWQSLPGTGDYAAVCPCDTGLFAVKRTVGIGRSQDEGVTWQAATPSLDATGFRSVVWTGKHLVAIDLYGAIQVSGEISSTADYLAWVASAGLSGESAHPDASPGSGGVPNALAYLWDADGDGQLQPGEKQGMPTVEPAGDGILSFSFLMPSREHPDLVLRLERSTGLEAWQRISEKVGTTPWQGSLVPVIDSPTPGWNRVRFSVNPNTGAAGFYRLSAAPW